MSKVEHIHENAWGAIIDRPGDDYAEIRWYDTTTEMNGEQFKEFLMAFASHMETSKRSGALVDATSFRMNPQHMDGPWRDANVIPRYMKGGVKKFAFHMPAGMPAIGGDPAPEGPADFPTAYFGTRAEALAWLNS